MHNITGIMAATRGGVIASNGALPWRYDDELDHFRDTTRDSIIIMGRKTYDLLPKSILETRQGLVLSRQARPNDKEAAVFFTDLNDILSYISACVKGRKVFMIGGGEIADEFLKNNLISSFLLTIINKCYSGDNYLKLEHFRYWQKEIIKITENYTIYSLKP